MTQQAKQGDSEIFRCFYRNWFRQRSNIKLSLCIFKGLVMQIDTIIPAMPISIRLLQKETDSFDCCFVSTAVLFRLLFCFDCCFCADSFDCSLLFRSIFFRFFVQIVLLKFLMIGKSTRLCVIVWFRNFVASLTVLSYDQLLYRVGIKKAVIKNVYVGKSFWNSCAPSFTGSLIFIVTTSRLFFFFFSFSLFVPFTFLFSALI